MPRQLPVLTLKRKIGNNQSPSMGTDYKLWAADCKKISEDDGDKDNGWMKPGSAPDNIKKVVDSMAQGSTCGEQSPEGSTEAASDAILNTCGVGVVVNYDFVVDDHRHPSPTAANGNQMATNFSLLGIDTDLTIIPNADILDIDAGYNKQLPGLGTISTIDKFPNYEQDPFYTPDDQFSNFKRAEKQGPFAGVQRLSNTALVADLISLQNRLPTGAMLPAFTRAFDLER